MKSFRFPPALLLFLGIALVITFTDRHFLFATPFHEVGDVAVNALQITDAKRGTELLGNYSRFHFHHPGPAFFYVYAGAEWLLCDALDTGMTPHNAHSLAGILIQSAFLALGLAILARQLKLPLFLPLALFAATVHLACADQKLASLWPPNVLIMPFFCFTVACITLAGGVWSLLPLVVISGSFLVHGHVAQPLFVVLLSVTAYGLAWRQNRRSGVPAPWRSHPGFHVLTALCLAVFLAPIVVDALRGEASNLSEIFRHMRDESSRKGLLKSFLYLLSFFSYRHDQDQLLHSLSWSSVRFLWEGIGYYLAWVTALVCGWHFVVRGRLPLATEPLTYLRRLAAFWVGLLALFLVWGLMQTGPMFEFNGYFFYSISYLGIVIACATVAALLEHRGTRRFGGIFYLCAAGTFHQFLAWPVVGEADAGRPLLANIQQAIQADPKPQAPKMLVFDHDDWPLVASVALALHRQNLVFYVDHAWDFMFKHERTIPLDTLVDPKAELSVWRIGRKTGTPGEVPLGQNTTVTFIPAKLSPTNGVIDFSDRGNLARYQLHGLSTPDSTFSWSTQPDVVLQFAAAPATDDVALEMIAEPLTIPGHPRIQPTELRFNGQLVFSSPFTEPGVLRALIPKDLWNRQPVAHVHIHLPNARSLSDLRVSGDIRVLSLAIKKLTTRRAEPPPR